MNHAALVAGALVVLAACGLAASPAGGPTAEDAKAGILTGNFAWTVGPPVLHAVPSGGEEWIAVKDPSVVRHNDRWHVFCTVRGPTRSHAVIYVSFAKWELASEAKPQVLPCHKGFFCAPQVFFFSPQKKWYLLCQASDESWTPKYQAAYATTADIADPNSWSKLQPLGAKPAEGKAGLDFWVIADAARAHLFFTTNDGRLWREHTALKDFPDGWSAPALAIQGDIFEASHTYRLKGLDKYLTLVEAQGGHGWRYYQAYLGERLEGPWTALAADKEKAFASMRNVRFSGERWTDAISHGELLRAACDEKLEVDPDHLRFLFQGVLDKERSGKGYGKIPWRLGILEPARPAVEPSGTDSQPGAPAPADRPRR